MIDHLFNILTNAMDGAFGLAILAAFGWGILSILLSPCHLSSIPLVIGYITQQKNTRQYQTTIMALLFATGILITIAVIGVITVSAGRLMGDVGDWSNYLIAALFMVIGLYLTGIINLDWNVAPVNQDIKKTYLGALILGLVFGVGLGPCTFAYMAPVLAIVFDAAKTNIWMAAGLIAAFGIGHCAVISVAGSLTGLVQKYLNWSGQSGKIEIIRRISGVLVILGGFYFIYLTF